MRYFLDISYKGTHYAGWQRQKNALGVQEVLEKALSTFLRQATQAHGAGRTDTGVHARQLMVHFEYEGKLDRSFFAGINGLLPYDIAVNKVLLPSHPGLHARFDAISRAYVYQIVRHKSPEHHEFAHWERQNLDLKAMAAAAATLLEFEEFASFCKAHGNQNHYRCDMQEVRWEEKDDLLLFHIRANRFLRGMVRAIVGTLLFVGRGKLTVEEFRQIIEAQDRQAAGPNAPAKGLFLTEVRYPVGSFIEKREERREKREEN
jgi:tRNA pseudouridine38-40 synthase